MSPQPRKAGMDLTILSGRAGVFRSKYSKKFVKIYRFIYDEGFLKLTQGND